MKKLTKKLFLSVFTALFAVVALGTSTFAWFSMNTKVTVSSMTVKATASKNLLISSTEDGTYLASLALTTKNESLVPVSTAVTTTPKFFKLDFVGSDMAADNSSRANSTFQEATAADYIKETMWVKSTGQSASNLRARVTFTGGDKALDPALRVMFVCGSTAYLMEPTTGASASYKAIANIEYVATTDSVAVKGKYYYKDAQGTKLETQPAENASVTGMYEQKITETSTNVTVTPNGSPILSSLSADVAVKIEVYIWYEGQDAACKSTNAVLLGTTVFSIEYTVE